VADIRARIESCVSSLRCGREQHGAEAERGDEKQFTHDAILDDGRGLKTRIDPARDRCSVLASALVGSVDALKYPRADHQVEYVCISAFTWPPPSCIAAELRVPLRLGAIIPGVLLARAGVSGNLLQNTGSISTPLARYTPELRAECSASVSGASVVDRPGREVASASALSIFAGLGRRERQATGDGHKGREQAGAGRHHSTPPRCRDQRGQRDHDNQRSGQAEETRPAWDAIRLCLILLHGRLQ
jgi:hypothetical protein